MAISTLTYDQFFITAVGLSSSLMVCSAAWIVRVLIQIEKSKVVALSSVLEDDGTGSSDLQFEESTSESGGKHLEVEPDDIPSGGAIEMSPTGKSRKTQSSPKSSPKARPMTARKARQKQRRISWEFLNIQIASVSVLVLLTYLLMVQSNAAIFLRVLGSLCVFVVFLRFQIGDELRRQRVDRIMLLLSLFLLIASMLSMLVYSMKELMQGEIYEGPARIVGYDQEPYNNNKHDPTTRIDVTVAWGSEWGCPWSGGKICKASVEGVICQTKLDKENTNYKSHDDNRRNHKRILEDGEDVDEQDEKEEEAEEVEDALEEDLEDEEKSNQELEQDNEALEAKNEMLEEEIEELKEENEIEDEENEELVDQENSELDVVASEYNEDIMIVEEEEYEDAQSYVDYEYEEEEASLEEDIESATDDEQKEELTEELEEDEEDQEELDEEYEEDEELLDEYADEYADAADESYSDFVDEQDETFDLEDEKEEVEDEVEETEAELDETDYGEGESLNDDIYDEIAEEVYEEEEEEIEEEEDYYDDDWYWNEYPAYYDDDSFEDGYWNYDWDSAWGDDNECEDLFNADIGGQTYDVDAPAGDDEWPHINIYGSCKTCDAYILDYFAEEAFEETQEYKQQAIVYLAGAMAGFVWTMLSYIKYRVLPTAENEIELLGSDGGVMA